MKCGFIGLGSQGAPMARRMIDADFDVTLWARRPDSLTPFANTKAKTAPSIAELGALADHLGICVVDDAGVREVCAAVIPAMREGSCIAIHSTVHPDTCTRLAEQAGARGIKLIDAPVSGGEPAARAGALTVMVGGDADAFAAAKPVFESFGKLILHLGKVGAGQQAKLINNALMAAHMGLAHHALQVGATLALERAALVELVKASSGRSFGFETYARLPTPQAFAHGGALLAKDVRLLGELRSADPSVATIRDLAIPFLNLVLNKPA
jgi:3-hydroxyisobutyrate dehydrogenase-like beta-hydroxyacid dehydrogenase